MTAEVRVNPAFHRFLIGRSGVNLREISERTGARIVFPSQGDHDNDSILIIGQQESIGKARAELEARIKDLVRLLLSLADRVFQNLSRFPRGSMGPVYKLTLGK